MCEEKRLLSCAVNPARDLLLKNRSKEAYWEEIFDYIFFILLSPLSSQERGGVWGNAPKKRKGKNVFTRREQQEHNAEGDSRGV